MVLSAMRYNFEPAGRNLTPVYAVYLKQRRPVNPFRESLSCRRSAWELLDLDFLREEAVLAAQVWLFTPLIPCYISH